MLQTFASLRRYLNCYFITINYMDSTEYALHSRSSDITIDAHFHLLVTVLYYIAADNTGNLHSILRSLCKPIHLLSPALLQVLKLNFVVITEHIFSQFVLLFSSSLVILSLLESPQLPSGSPFPLLLFSLYAFRLWPSFRSVCHYTIHHIILNAIALVCVTRFLCHDM